MVIPSSADRVCRAIIRRTAPQLEHSLPSITAVGSSTDRMTFSFLMSDIFVKPVKLCVDLKLK
jgi:hypothetical protein